MSNRRLGLLVFNLFVAAIVVSFVATAPAPVTKAANNAWSIVSSPNSSSDDNILTSVAAVSANDVWAVGYYDDGLFGDIYPLTVHWNGTAWGTYSAPEHSGSDFTELLSVTAISTDDVWAVGYYLASGVEHTFTLHWHNSQWTEVDSPDQGTGSNRLTSVAAVSSNQVWAVGYYNTGSTTRTLTMKWNGSAWSIVTSPSPAQPNSTADFLTGVAASSSGDVKAVGYFNNSGTYKTLALHWDPVNSVWLAPSIPNVGSGSNYLNGVTIIGTGSNDAYAVGYYHDTSQIHRTLILHWNGNLWSSETSANSTGNDNELQGVAAVNSTYVWSVGQFDKPSIATLTQRRLSGSWNVVTSPNQASNGDNFLNGVAVVPGTSVCAGGDIWSVGYYRDGGAAQTLILRYTITPSCDWDP